jgi:asparagine N-glycosylation enzyme membrane subunit Stt3
MHHHRLTIAVVAVVAVNLVGRIAWVVAVQPQQRSDFGSYLRLATYLASGEGYVTGGEPTALFPVGWPLFLSMVFRVTGPSVTAGLITQATLSALTVGLVLLLARRITGSIGAGVAAAALYSALPAVWAWNAVLGSEELFTFLLLASLWLYLSRGEQWRWLVAAGVTMGLAALVRPTVLPVPLVLLALHYLQSRDWRLSLARVGAFTLAMAVVIMPWTVRNAVVLDAPVLVSTNGGMNAWMGTQSADYYWPEDSSANPLLAVDDEVERDALGKRLFLRHLTNDPGDLVALVPDKLAAFFEDPHAALWLDVGTEQTEVLYTAGAWGFHVLIALGALGLVALRRYPRRWEAITLAVFFAYYTALFTVFPASERFRFPLMPIVAVFAGAGVWAALRRTGAVGEKRELAVHRTVILPYRASPVPSRRDA